jgi:hypothetical protein
MSWKSHSEIEALLDNFLCVERLELAYSLHRYAVHAIFPSGYSASPLWQQLVIPSKAGQAYLELLPKDRRNLSLGDLHMALFGQLYYHDLLIDLEESDLEGISELLNQELLQTKLRWPYRFGRLLYDKFNDMVQNDRTIKYLEPEKVAILLEKTPQGVYQVGKLLSGPLGLLTSREARYTPPLMTAPLWHCSDTGCTKVHPVAFKPPDIYVVNVFSDLHNEAIRRSGPASDWHEVLRTLHRRSQPSKATRYHDMVPLIGDAIVGKERTTLLIAALESPNRKWLRDTLASSQHRKKDATGPAQQVVARLSEAEKLQMLLLLNNDELVALIDACVIDKCIQIPSNELRIPHVRNNKLNPWDSYGELSSFGLRADRRYPLVVLMSAIWRMYESQNLLDELSWKLGKPEGILSRNILMDHIQEHGPAEVVKDLILPSKPVALSIANELDLLIRPDEERDQLVNRFLWKFGFDPSRYGDEYLRLRSRMRQFKDVLLRIGSISTENDREEVRSHGVNLFVSVEDFLTELISYNVWLLASDHFIDTRNRFRYDARWALDTVGEHLSRQKEIDGTAFGWDTAGNNTLGSLLVYLTVAGKWMTSLMGKESADVQRSSEHFPAYVEDAEVVFPFAHTELWADCDPNELANFVEGFEVIAKRLLKANLAEVRNGLDHKRNDSSFPTTDNMLDCVNSLQDAFDYADINRYIPKAFWRVSGTTDRYGRRENVLCDYRGRDVLIKEPTTVYNRGSLSTKEPMLVAPGNLLGLPNAKLIFRILHTSEYAEYWKGYPRRRSVPSPDEELSTSGDTLADLVEI